MFKEHNLLHQVFFSKENIYFKENINRNEKYFIR